jgi:hypothetical protein
MLVDLMVSIVEIEPYITSLWKPEHAKELLMTSYGKCQSSEVTVTNKIYAPKLYPPPKFGTLDGRRSERFSKL